MTRMIENDSMGWWAQDGYCTTQTFTTKAKLEAALAAERRLMIQQGLQEPATPLGSPLNWSA